MNAEKMNRECTELVFILDKSGSMCGLEADTIGGFNGMINKQKKEKGQALVSLILFDDEIETVLDRVPIENVAPLTDKDYTVGGCTALLDAVGCTINRIQKTQKSVRDGFFSKQTLVVIMTDGFENASKEYTYRKVQELIEKQKKADWQFIFLGANMDAIQEAGRFGIAKDNAVSYCCDEVGTALNFDCVSDAVSMVRACKAVDKNWKTEIEADYQKRTEKDRKIR